MRARLHAAAFALALPTLACGFWPQPCDEARPARQRELDEYRAALRAGIDEWNERYRQSPSARARGAHSAAAQTVSRLERDLRAADEIERLWQAGDEEGARDLVRDLSNSFSAIQPDADELRDADLAVKNCTE
ncbi:MAG TPA: hypothetical protein DEF51_17345 [Myxococcales bacterium]|nr:hypothetical protein [Myxococcales bacterium]